MAFLVRKIIKKSSVDLIKQSDDLESMSADPVTTEFKIQESSMSCWLVNSINDQDLNQAVLAVALMGNSLDTMDFIAIDTSFIPNHSLEYSQTYPGRPMAIPELEKLHYDIQNITIARIKNCLELYKDAMDNNATKTVFRRTLGEIKKIIKDANNRINPELLNSDLKAKLVSDKILPKE